MLGAAVAALGVAGVAGLAARADRAPSAATRGPAPPASCPGGVPLTVLDYGSPLDSQEQRSDVYAVRLRGDSVSQVQLTEEYGVAGEVSLPPDGRITTAPPATTSRRTRPAAVRSCT